MKRQTFSKIFTALLALCLAAPAFAQTPEERVLEVDPIDQAAMNAAIAGTLVNTFAPLLLNTGMMIFYLVPMTAIFPLIRRE